MFQIRQNWIKLTTRLHVHWKRIFRPCRYLPSFPKWVLDLNSMKITIKCKVVIFHATAYCSYFFCISLITQALYIYARKYMRKQLTLYKIGRTWFRKVLCLIINWFNELVVVLFCNDFALFKKPGKSMLRIKHRFFHVWGRSHITEKQVSGGRLEGKCESTRLHWKVGAKEGAAAATFKVFGVESREEQLLLQRDYTVLALTTTFEKMKNDQISFKLCSITRHVTYTRDMIHEM